MLRHAEALADRITGLAMEVHAGTGPGLDAEAYQRCLCLDLANAGLSFQEQVPVPVRYDGKLVDCGLIAGLIVDNAVVVEIRAADALTDHDDKALRSCTRFSGCRVGLLLNFNTVSMADGIKRLVT